MRRIATLLGLLLVLFGIETSHACSTPAISSQTCSFSGTTLTCLWTTDVASDSAVSHGSTGYSVFSGGYLVSQDTVTPVTSHSVVIPNLASSRAVWITSRSFTGGAPDWACTAKASMGTFTPTIPTQAGQLTLLGSAFFPVNNGISNEVTATPGYGVLIQLSSNALVIPSGGYTLSSGGGVKYTFSSPLLSNYAVTVRSHTDGGTGTDGGSLPISLTSGCGGGATQECGNVSLLLPSTVATGGSDCTTNGGTIQTGGCLYPFSVTATANDGNCGGTLTCPPYTKNGNILVKSNTSMALPIGPGWAGEADIPCRTRTTMFADACTCLITAGDNSCTSAQCPDQVSTVCYYSFDSLMANNPAQKLNTWAEMWGLGTFNWSTSANPNWFYEACQVDRKLGTYTGLTSQWNTVAQFCLHTMRDHQQYPPVKEASGTGVFSLTGNGAPTYTDVDSCHTIVTGFNGTQICGTLTVPFSTTDITNLVNGLAAGNMYVATDTTNGKFSCHVLSADNVGKTFTVECTPSVAAGNTDNWSIAREISNLSATAGTSATSLVCSTCDFTNVAIGDVAYIVSGVTNGVMAEWDGISTQTGSKVTAINAGTHTLTLTGGGITGLTSGSVIQVRHWVGPSAPADIYDWPEQLKDEALLNSDHISADTVNNMSAEDAPFGTGVVAFWEDQRELASQIHSCQVVLDIRNVLGTSDAIAPSPMCLDSAIVASLWDAEFAMIDSQVNNAGVTTALPFSYGTQIDTFLGGEQAYTIVKALSDPLIYTSGDPRGPYWVKTFTDFLWVNGYQYNNPSCGAIYFHEFPYEFESPHQGLCDTTPITISGVGAVANLWSEQALITPALAWLCTKTFGSTIPGTSTTYCAAFNDEFRYQAEYSIQAFDAAVAPGPKTVGQFGLWMIDAFAWVGNASYPTASCPQCFVDLQVNQ